MRSLLKINKLTNGFGHGNPNIPRPRKYLDVHLDYLRKIVPGTPYKIVLEKFNKRFGFSIDLKALRGLCKRRKIQNGLTGCFPQGHVPFNKGRKGYCAPGCEKGWFKKGGKPPNTMPLGSERITADGYVEVKISEKSGPPNNRWKGKHILIWEKEHGPVPKGYVVIFLDGDRRNFNLNNLLMISRAEHGYMCHNRLFSENNQLTTLGHDMAALKVAVSQRKKNTFTGFRKEKMVFVSNTGSKYYVAKVVGKERYCPARKSKHGLCRMHMKKIRTWATFEEAQLWLYKYAKKRGWRVL
jgi:hypothetical protein